MAETTLVAPTATLRRRLSGLTGLWVLVALLLVFVGVLTFLVTTDARSASRGAESPSEGLLIEKVTFPDADQLVVEVTNTGAEAMTVAQVQVDEAYWTFTISPAATIPPGAQATITIPYRWMFGTQHIVALVTATGEVFEGETDVAP